MQKIVFSLVAFSFCLNAHALKGNKVEDVSLGFTANKIFTTIPIKQKHPETNFIKSIDQKSYGYGIVFKSELGDLVIPVSVVEKFEYPTTLETDIEFVGFKMDEVKKMFGEPKTKEYKWGTLAYWNTPTEKTSFYYYLKPKNNKNAIRVGPYPSFYIKFFDLIWDDVKVK